MILNKFNRLTRFLMLSVLVFGLAACGGGGGGGGTTTAAIPTCTVGTSTLGDCKI